MPTTQTFDRFESFCVLLIAVAVFVWKPGIYVSSGLICAYLMTRTCIDKAYREELWRSQLTRLSLGMFGIGLLTATLGADRYEDATWLARKTLFLPVLVFLCFALKRSFNERLAMAGLIISFWIAAVLTLWEHDWQFLFGGRMQGTWPLGTWDSLQGLFFPFLVLYICSRKISMVYRVVCAMTAVAALVMLLLAGGRAPWLGAFISLMVYFLVFKRNRQVLLGLLGIALVAGALSVTVFEEKTKPVLERLTTVTNTTTEGSNWVRLRLWEIGMRHLSVTAVNDPWSFVFGGGSVSYDAKQIEFFKTLPYDAEDRERLQEYGYPSGDTHNTYIDNALRHGVLWTGLITLYLIWVCTRLSWRYVRQQPESLVLLLGLLFVGMFYTMVPHFATFFFVVFVALLDSPKHERSASN